MRRAVSVGGLLLGATLLLGACGGSINAAGNPVPPGPGDQVAGSVTVLADPSLRDVFEQAAASVERDHPKVAIHVRYGSVADGTGGADVVASTSRQALDRLRGEGVLGDADVVAQQLPALVAAPRNPGHVDVLRDLGRSGVSIGLCSTATSCGEATGSLLQRADVHPTSVRRSSDSEAVLQAVTDSTVDAGVVWASDIRGPSGQAAFRKGVREVVLAAAPQQNIRLQGAGSRPVLTAIAVKGNQRGAQAFVDFLRGGVGQQLLRSDGFR